MKRGLFLLLGIATLGAIDLQKRCWEIGAELLYWRPCSPSYEYGTIVHSDSDVESLAIQPDYEAGFRIFGATYTWDCCHIFSIDWTRLYTSDAVKKSAGTLFVFPNETDLTDATVRARLKYRYNKVNVRAGRYIASYCDSKAYVFGGIRYVNIERFQEAKAGSVQSFQSSKFDGAAFEVGFGMVAEEGCGFAITGHFAGLMGIGERRLTQKVNTIRYRHPSHTACIPGLEARLGVRYRYECSCFWINAEIGYEIDHYFDALALVTDGNAIRNTTNPAIGATSNIGVGFSGPYLQISVRF